MLEYRSCPMGLRHRLRQRAVARSPPNTSGQARRPDSLDKTIPHPGWGPSPLPTLFPIESRMAVNHGSAQSITHDPQPARRWQMSKARLVITAVVVEGRSQAEVARAYDVSKGWVSKLVARFRSEGEAAYEARSRRPATSPNATPPARAGRMGSISEVQVPRWGPRTRPRWIGTRGLVLEHGHELERGAERVEAMSKPRHATRVVDGPVRLPSPVGFDFQGSPRVITYCFNT